MTTPAIEIQDLSLAFRGAPVLENINLTLDEGDFLGLIGPNGAGKTVFLKIILGILKPDSGTVKILGGTPEEARGRIGYVPQYARFDADFPITVLDVVLMGRLGRSHLFKFFTAEDRELALSALKRVEMESFATRQIGKLSGGQLQRVLIARALAANPKILLLDEPTASLDTNIGKHVYELLSELSSSMTIILVSHDIGVISSHVKTIGCLNRRLHYHNSREITGAMLEEVYGCPVDLIAHGHSHRVLSDHHHHHEPEE